jgi:hypothetical protein
MKKRFALVLLVAIVVSQALSQTFAIVQHSTGQNLGLLSSTRT